MRTFVAVACLVLVAVTLAGCGEDPERYPDGVSASSSTSRSGSATGSGTVTGTGTTSATGTSTGPAGNGSSGNHAPHPKFSASTENGSLPLTVNFTLEGSDDDGDALNWTLAFGDGNSTEGDEVPATVSHVYEAAGNFTAVYTLTDGNESVDSNLTLRVLAGGAAFTAVFTEKQTAPSNPANSVESPAGFCGASCCGSFDSGQSGVDCVLFELDPSYAGHLFIATADSGDPDLEIWEGCDPTLLFSIEGHLADGPESGVIPAGAGCVVMWAKEPPAAPTHTFTVI